jgi:hypothetical protein
MPQFSLLIVIPVRLILRLLLLILLWWRRWLLLLLGAKMEGNLPK